ncbi:MAG: phosphate ABC transporter permease subunit PstC [Solirubrobacterales bacterium]|nr:phosphate ABC transporter permease subunit PstC [Solirubrobacterales bacterium]
MSVRASLNPRAAARGRVAMEGSLGDRILRGLCIAAGLLAGGTLLAVAYQVISGARLSISTFGLPFLVHSAWAPNLGHFGAAVMLYGTAVSSAIALLISTPVAIAIAIYLSMLAPRAVRIVVGPLVEMLAAIPSVILGLWGIIVLAPFMQRHVEPALHGVLGFIPIFGPAQTTGLGVFTAGVILTVMVVPIIASLSRDLFLSVPRELTDAAESVGATRWEVIRGVVLPTTVSGVSAAIMLGLGRALGEAIAVASVIGAGNVVHVSTFETGNSLAARIALDFAYIVSNLHTASLFYLALILLVFGLLTNLIARQIASRYDVHRTFA